MARTEVKPGASLTNFLLWVLAGLIALASLIYLVMGDDPASPAEIDKGEFGAPVAAPESVLLPAADQQIGPEVGQEPVVSATDEVVVDMPAEVVPAAGVSPAVRLTFSFTEECWVEVSDAENRILYGLEKPGDIVGIEGVPPFRLFIGNVNGVSIKVQGKDFPVPRTSGSSSKTARFVITETDVSAVTAQ
jgi:hypothetical protein